MLARIVKDEQDNLTWERLTSSVVGNTPLGAVYAIWSNTVPDGFLPCNGAQFDKTQYPFLFSLLGTDYLPDLRECTLVGIGQNNTDTLTTHDIYTLGQFKDFSTAGSGEVKSAGYTVSGNNVTLNSTVNTANRKLVTQYVADADATDLQTLKIGGASVTRMRSKGVNYIIKAIPGNEVGDYNYVIDQMEADLALKVNLEYVNALPTGDDIGNNIYGYQGHYYVPHLDKESPAQSYLTELANLSDIQPVIDALNTKQPKTLSSPITIGGVSSATVESALGNLNSLCDTKLPMVTSLPLTPSNQETVLYIGTSSGGLKTGGIYQYQVSEWVLISYAESFTFNSDDFDVGSSTNEVSLLPSRRVFNGTTTEWGQLTTEDKIKYGATAFTDDESDSIETSISVQATMVNETIGKEVKCYPKSFKIQLYLGGLIDSSGKLCSFTLPTGMVFRTGGWGTCFTGYARNTASGEIVPTVIIMNIANGVATLTAEGVPSGYTEVRVLNVTLFSTSLT